MIFDSLRSMIGAKPKTAAPAIRRTLSAAPVIRSRFDAASYSDNNIRHWSNAEFHSADAEGKEGVRKTLRVRSRYEVANNSYAKGIVLTIANDTIGTGPRLQCLTDNNELNSRIEYEFVKWAEKIRLADKLRTMRMSKCQDGEVFIMLGNNPKLEGDVKFDIQLIEADRVTDLNLSIMPKRIDGITFDDYGNPVSYHVLKYHPGSDELGVNPLEYTEIPAKYILHYFRADRPAQHRGIPEITPALPLFAQLRRYTLAVVSAAEAAADFAGILYTDAPAGGEAEDLAMLDPIHLERNMMLTMPGGWKMDQLDPKQPCSTYAEFKKEILNEIARCLNMPFNVAAGNSSGYNYASGRMDWQTYFKSIRVEQHVIAKNILDPIFATWVREYALAAGYMVDEVPDHQWFWDGMEHVDPLKEASAQEKRLADHMTTFAAEYAKQGIDWEDAFAQIAREKKRMQELGITAADLPGGNNNQNDEEDEDGD